MQLDPFLTAAGSVGSVLGAIVSGWQAILAGRSAKTAKAASEEIVKRISQNRKISTLSELTNECKNVQGMMRKYASRSPASMRSGVSIRKDADEVQKFFLAIREHKNLFQVEEQNELDRYLEELQTNLSQFVGNGPDGVNHGNGILLNLSTLMEFLRRIHTKHSEI